MSQPLRFLLLEDNPTDAELNECVLREAGLVFESRRVDRRDEFIAALKEFKPDVVLADYSLPHFDGFEALAIVREGRSQLPFIFVTGAMGEEKAVETLYQGANDYLLKDRLGRLPEAVNRVLKEAQEQQQLAETKRALETSEARFRALVETSADWIWEIDAEGRYTYCSPRVYDMLGYAPEEVQGQSLFKFMPAEEAERVRPIFAEIAASRRPFRLLDKTYWHKDGHERFLEGSGAPVFDPAGNFIGYRGSNRDITERKLNEMAVLQRARQVEILFEENADGILIIDLEGLIRAANPAAGALFGTSVERLKGASFGVPVKAGDLSEITVTDKSGESRTLSLRSSLIVWEGRPAFLASLQDLTESKQREEQLDRLAHLDPLTRLPNRLLLSDRLSQAIARNNRSNTHLAICYLDLDGFKQVNDSLGHQCGDKLLVAVANRLNTLLRQEDTVARLGGDEFVLLLNDLAGVEECQEVVKRVIAAIAAPYVLDGKEYLGISASIGVTIYPGDDADPDTLIRHADHAMFAAKQAGKNCHQLYDLRLEQRVVARRDSLKRIEKALRAGQFVLHYQPKVDCRRGRISGVEALIRWQHPTLGLLPPAEFLPLIEEDRLADAVGQWVFREAFAQVLAWKAQGIDLQVSVNVFTRQLSDPDFSKQLDALLKAHPGIEPSDIQIEVVETGALEDVGKVQKILAECHALGVSFSLDDFGTGKSTLVYLRHLPARELKIDRSFVSGMLVNRGDLAIVDAVIGLGRAFGLSVVAEGVETPSHIQRLLELGCEVMQGYVFARPMPGSEISHWARDFKLHAIFPNNGNPVTDCGCDNREKPWQRVT